MVVVRFKRYNKYGNSLDNWESTKQGKVHKRTESLVKNPPNNVLVSNTG